MRALRWVPAWIGVGILCVAGAALAQPSTPRPSGNLAAIQATTQPVAGPTTCPTTRPARPAPRTYTYLGRYSRGQVWFDDKYRRFADKIAFVNGQYVDIGERVLKPVELNLAAAPIGSYGETPSGCKVRAVLKDAEIIAYRAGTSGHYARTLLGGHTVWVPEEPDLDFHAKGVPAQGLVDGADFRAKLVRIGTYRYQSSTVPSYVVYSPLTKEQFADALAKGFELVDYRIVKGSGESKVVATPADAVGSREQQPKPERKSQPKPEPKRKKSKSAWKPWYFVP